MKKIIIYFFGFVFLAMTLSGANQLFAAEETPAMMCDGGVVNIGDKEVDVRDKCGEPNNQEVDEWVYNPGPSRSFKVIFEDGKVVRILESH